MLPMPFPLLIQTSGVCATFVIRIGELNRIIFPAAHLTDDEGSGRLFIKRELTATRTREGVLAHGCVKYISTLFGK